MNNQMSIFGDEDSGVERYPTAFLAPDPDAPHLKRIHIQSFKGIKHQEIEFPQLAILAGPNNSGKSAILEAIVTAFECFRLCLDTDKWKMREHGRSVRELDCLRVNQPKDIWFQAKTRRPRAPGESRPREQYVSISLVFTNGFSFTAQIRYLYGYLNVGVTNVSENATESVLRRSASCAPVLVRGVSGLTAHEPLYTPAEVHREAGSGLLSRILRNVLSDILQKDEKALQTEDPGSHAPKKFDFIREAIRRHFAVELQPFTSDPLRDLEIRSPYREEDYELDIVSAGSGLIQILQLASFVAWRASRIVLFDEPDSHLHTSLQARLFGFLKEISDRMNLQMIMATHSRDLISQAPMDSIIPVDPKKRELSSIRSTDHLLLEYKRYGGISNFDLALLYQCKRCLFVEGPSDVKYLRAFADRLGINCFQGPYQVVMFEFRGAGKFTMLRDLVELFERMVGSPITWMVLRDRDWAIPSVIEKYKEQARAKGISNFHIWQRFSIENYLLETPNLHAAVSRKLDHMQRDRISQDEITQLLQDACYNLSDECRAQYVSQTMWFYKNLGISDDWATDGPRDALRFWDTSARDPKNLVVNLPGGRIFGNFVKRLQDNCGVNIKPEEVISVMTPDMVPEEVRIFLGKLDKL